MEYLVTFLEGVVTFISPCLLPLLPLYLAYFGGGEEGQTIAHTMIRSLAFICGFSLVFVLLGAFAGTVGTLLVSHRSEVNLVCGLIVVAMGFSYLGLFDLPFLKGVPARATAPHDLLSTLLFGMVFAVAWSPCVGTFLASALSLAATSASAVRGVLLLLCYSLGLGLPFALSAVLIDQLKGAFGCIKAHYEVLRRAFGGLLVLLGVLMATGHGLL